MEEEILSILWAISPDGAPVDAEDIVSALVGEGTDLFSVRTALAGLVEAGRIEVLSADSSVGAPGDAPPRTMLRPTVGPGQ